MFRSAYGLVDGTIGISDQAGRWRLSAWVRNLFDNHYTEYRHDDVAERVVWLTLGASLQR